MYSINEVGLKRNLVVNGLKVDSSSHFLAIDFILFYDNIDNTHMPHYTICLLIFVYMIPCDLKPTNVPTHSYETY